MADDGPGAARRDGPLTVAAQVWTVAGLLLAVTDALAARFAAITVRGELSGFTRAASGHCYFTLKDAQTGAALRCAMFRRAAQMLTFLPRDGQQVELRGRLAVYESRGELQMVVEALQTVGVGSLYEEFLRLRARLESQGLFDASRKRALPAYPRCIGVITSAAGAALHDVLTALQRRAPHVAVQFYPSAVQGAEAPAALVAALAAAQQAPRADVLILCRGGGSLEDLWAFNDERVVRAVAASSLPLVCGVGHETDVTLSDLAADLRAATPTAAAELVAPAREALWLALQERFGVMQRAVTRRLEGAVQRLDLLSLHLQRPAHLVGTQSARLASLRERHQAALWQALRLAAQSQQHQGMRLKQWAHASLERQRALVLGQQRRLEALDPRRVLARGYAWVETSDGQPVVSARSLAVGQAVRAVWADSEADATISATRSKRPANSGAGQDQGVHDRTG